MPRASVKNLVKSDGSAEARAQCRVFAKPLLGAARWP
jgi:hypothetical protein